MITRSAEETIAFAEDLAKHLKPCDIIALIGELGSGKTTFVKGIAKGLGVEKPNYVNSPSFVLIREYKGRVNLYHLDLYRLDNITDIEALGLEEYFFSDGISAVEWAEKLKGLLSAEHLRIEIDILGSDLRRITLKPFGKRYVSISSRYLDKNS